MKIKLEIKAEDIETSNYLDGYDCAITRSLIRAGHPELMDVGILLKKEGWSKVLDNTNPAYEYLSRRVICMYNGLEAPADFEIEIEY